jgi:hypothetical protein
MDNPEMDSVPEENKQIAGDDPADQNNGRHEKHGRKTFFTAEVLDISGGIIFLVFSGGFHLIGGGFHLVGFAFDFAVVFCALLAISYHVDEKSFRRFGLRFWFVLALAFCLICFLAWSVCFKKPEQSTAFKIIPREMYVETKTPRHFLMWDANGRFIPSPINVIMLAQFTNLRHKAMDVNSYQFEGRATNGLWEIMPTLDTKYGSVISFFGTNWGPNGFGIIFGSAKEGDVCDANFGDDVFPKMITGNTMQSGASLEGFFFLESPKHGFDGTMRCRVQTGADEEFLELVSPLNDKQLNTPLPKNHSGGGVLYGRTNPSSDEIKKMPVVPYSKEWGLLPADTQETNHSSKFNPALFVAWTVLGFGVCWMCFGWIFSQKRKD